MIGGGGKLIHLDPLKGDGLFQARGHGAHEHAIGAGGGLQDVAAGKPQPFGQLPYKAGHRNGGEIGRRRGRLGAGQLVVLELHLDEFRTGRPGGAGRPGK